MIDALQAFTCRIWNLEEEKIERCVLADAQRDLIDEADRLAALQVTVRG